MNLRHIKFYLLITVTLIFNTISYSQDSCKVVVDERSGKQMLIGTCDESIFADSNFSWWYDYEYENYLPGSLTLEKLESKINDYEIKIVMGTWCSDSRREVPRFYKILDELNYPDDKVELIMVDRNKKGVADETEGLNIELVPTFIFYKNGEEVGRIIETPEQTLEVDMKNIIR